VVWKGLGVQPAFTQKSLSALALPGALLVASLLFIAVATTGAPDAASLMGRAGLSLLMSAGIVI
jgi:hypothetical protein